ncbi:MAG: hypothetical protein ABW199_09270 [Caulobacterales bacterium]
MDKIVVQIVALVLVLSAIGGAALWWRNDGAHDALKEVALDVSKQETRSQQTQTEVARSVTEVTGAHAREATEINRRTANARTEILRTAGADTPIDPAFFDAWVRNTERVCDPPGAPLNGRCDDRPPG